jgi:hypothetical protein
MTYYADLAHHGYFMPGPFFRAVGWLSAEHPFSTGETPSGLVMRLKEFRGRGGGQKEIGWPSELGKHTCELCDSYETAGEIAVPAAGILYMAPNMISHYVEVHHYAPPGEFITAFMASPLPGTDEYRLAAAPFRLLCQELIKEAIRRQEERSIDTAADWILRHGGDEDAVQAWERKFWSDPPVAPKMCGSVAATIEHLDRLREQFLARIREQVKSMRERQAPK